MSDNLDGRFVTPIHSLPGKGWIGQVLNEEGKYCDVSILWVQNPALQKDPGARHLKSCVAEFGNVVEAMRYLKSNVKGDCKMAPTTVSSAAGNFEQRLAEMRAAATPGFTAEKAVSGEQGSVFFQMADKGVLVRIAKVAGVVRLTAEQTHGIKQFEDMPVDTLESFWPDHDLYRLVMAWDADGLLRKRNPARHS